MRWQLARPAARSASSAPRAAEDHAELLLGGVEHPATLGAEPVPGAVHVKSEHRHGRAERVGLPAATALGGALQRHCNLARAPPGEDARLEVERIAGLGHVLGPPA